VNISKYAIRWWPKVTGCATCMWVKPGISVAAWREARSRRPSRTLRSRTAMPSISPRSHRRMSVATWSLRERAVCSRFPASPTSSVSRASMLRCTSSRSTVQSNVPAAHLGEDRSHAALDVGQVGGRDELRPREHARVRDRSWMSTSARRLSKVTDALKRCVRRSTGSAKRPDHALPVFSSSCTELAAVPNGAPWRV
jgi:hypothetical protein